MLKLGKKHQIKKWYRESKKIIKNDTKENWEGDAIIAGGTFAGVLILLFWIMYVFVLFLVALYGNNYNFIFLSNIGHAPANPPALLKDSSANICE